MRAPTSFGVLTERGLRVFLDLKWHDIPNTVAEAVAAARALGVAMATVHTLGGAAMMEAAARAAGGRVALVGVTVLTSHDPAGYARAVGRGKVDLAAEVERQSGEAIGAGLGGVVCSPQEVARVRAGSGPTRGSSCPASAAGRRIGATRSAWPRRPRRWLPARPIWSWAGPSSWPPIRRPPSAGCSRRRSASAPDAPLCWCCRPRRPAGRSRPGLAAAAERARGAWFAHDAAGLVADSPRLLVQLPGADPSAALGPAQAAALLADFLATAQEVETTVRAAREVEPGRGYVELQRRYRITGTQDVRTQSLLLGYRQDADGLEPGGAPGGGLSPRRLAGMPEPATSTIRCPVCGQASEATMPSDACLYFWDCPACSAVVKPKPGDCCVFCSYGSELCPPRQREATGG